MQSMSFFQYKGQNYSRILGLKDQPVIQPRKPVSFTSARRYSKDPGALWSREPPDFRGNSNCRLFAI